MSKLDDIIAKVWATGIGVKAEEHEIHNEANATAKAEIKSLMLDVYKESIASDNFTHLEFEKKVEEL